MPPRRSSRSGRTLVEHTPIETLPPKRKRGSTVETTTEKNENVTKPPSRTMSSGRATAPAARTRASRSKISLSKIEESTEGEEEEEAQAPVKKKVRPSLDAGDEDGRDEKPVKPTQTRRSARSSIKKEVDEDDQVIVSQPPKRPPTKRGRAASQTTTTPNTTVEELEGEDVKPRTHDRRSRNILDGGVERADVPLNDSKEGHKSRGSKARVSFETPSKEQKADEDVDVETYPIRNSQPPSQPKPMQPQADEEGGGEEFHLVDPIPMPNPETLAQSIHEQPYGPQTRLVIHKIVLVNFKSYAGRQIIGPFHKVRAQFY